MPNVDLAACRTLAGYEVCGMVWERYLRLGGPTSVLGPPTSDEFAVADGRGRGGHFAAGDIYWSASTGAYEVVAGPVLDTWLAAGGVTGVLGFPVGGLSPQGTGHTAAFEFGTVAVSPTTGTWLVLSPVDQAWRELGGGAGVLGYPLLDERPAVGADTVTFFQGGAVYVSGEVAPGGHADGQVDVQVDGRRSVPATEVPTVFALGLADFGVVRADRVTDPAALSEVVWTTDGCSGPTPANVDALFREACVRHDFGYRNFLSGPRVDTSPQRRLAIDDQFLVDARATCEAGGQPRVRWQLGITVSCVRAARLMYDAIRLFGR